MSNSSDNRWMTATSGLKGNNAPIPINFSIPAQLQTSTSAINLIDNATAQVKMNPPLIIPDGCCIDLINASFPYTQPNIAPASAGLATIPTGNNRVSIDFNSTGFVELTVPAGLYDYTDVQYAWNSYAISAGWVPPSAASQQLFIFTGISATQKLVITVDPLALAGGVFPAGGIVLDFTNPSPVSGLDDSIGEVLGFPTSGAGAILTVPGAGTTPESFTSPDAADFAATSAYALYMSLVTNSYQNGLQGQLLYVFPLGQFASNSVISWQSSLRYPVPAVAGNHSFVNIWTTDQAGNKLPWKYYQSPFNFSVTISRNKPDGSI